MPEGHTIHRLARDHGRWLAGRRVVVRSPQGRFADGAALLDGRHLVAVDAVGKHLLYRFDEAVLHVHLGLFGRYRRHRLPAPDPRDTTRLLLRGDTHEVHLIGPTACELLDADAEAALRARLGPDPLRDDADPERVWERLQRSRRAIGAVLLDQGVVAGVGNVFRAELLWLVGVWPHLPARDLPRDRFERLWSDACRLLALGVRVNRIVTVPEELSGRPPHRARRGERTFVYGRRNCLGCGGAVVRETLGARTSYACPACQGLGR